MYCAEQSVFPLPKNKLEDKEGKGCPYLAPLTQLACLALPKSYTLERITILNLSSATQNQQKIGDPSFRQIPTWHVCTAPVPSISVPWVKLLRGLFSHARLGIAIQDMWCYQDPWSTAPRLGAVAEKEAFAYLRSALPWIRYLRPKESFENKRIRAFATAIVQSKENWRSQTISLNLELGSVSYLSQIPINQQCHPDNPPAQVHHSFLYPRLSTSNQRKSPGVLAMPLHSAVAVMRGPMHAAAGQQWRCSIRAPRGFTPV